MTILWEDDIQTGSDPWGFFGYYVQHPIDTNVTPSDANGANISVVNASTFGGGSGKAIRHYHTPSGGGSRIQIGHWTEDNVAFSNQLNNNGEIWVEAEFWFPESIIPTGNFPWLNLWDFHSTDGLPDLANRRHTNPGVFICSSAFGACPGTMRFVFRDFPGNSSGIASVSVPVAEWVKFQFHWQWSTSSLAQTLYMNGSQLIQFNAVTKTAGNTLVEMWLKTYGEDDGGTWDPNPIIRYIRNVKFADAFITDETVASTPVARTIFI